MHCPANFSFLWGLISAVVIVCHSIYRLSLGSRLNFTLKQKKLRWWMCCIVGVVSWFPAHPLLIHVRALTLDIHQFQKWSTFQLVSIPIPNFYLNLMEFRNLTDFDINMSSLPKSPLLNSSTWLPCSMILNFLFFGNLHSTWGKNVCSGRPTKTRDSWLLRTSFLRGSRIGSLSCDCACETIK